MILITAAFTDIGRVRPNNEDAFLCYEPGDAEEERSKGWLFVVADGMGGHRGGDIASSLAVRTVQSSYYADNGEDRAKALKNAVEHANRIVLNESAADESLVGMGTTCTAAVVREGFAYFVHVGDSRSYVLREGVLVQITQDHSLVGEMVRSGMLSDEDARKHPQRNVITRSLGVRQTVSIDTPLSPFELQKGDVLMLCSDGLTSMVTDKEISAILKHNDPTAACSILVDTANQKGGLDNITVVICDVAEI